MGTPQKMLEKWDIPTGALDVWNAVKDLSSFKKQPVEKSWQMQAPFPLVELPREWKTVQVESSGDRCAQNIDFSVQDDQQQNDRNP